jgi:hypothetical protein
MGEIMLINSVYGMASPKPNKDYQKKLAAAIQLLGDKYRLAKPITKLEGKQNGNNA